VGYCFIFIDLLVGIGGVRLSFESLVVNVFSQANGTTGQKEKIHPVDEYFSLSPTTVQW
jgi:hypothetical protein